MKKEKLIKTINDFRGKKIGVIGDLMLDQFVWGDASRISPEAPIPVVLVSKESFAPGGASNTANNIAALRGEVSMVGLVGKDEAAAKLIKLLKTNNIDTSGIVECSDRPTTQKVRIVAQGQQIVRIDREDNTLVDNRTEKKLIKFIDSKMKDWNAVVISDYAKGLITKSLVSGIISLAKKHKKIIIVSPKPQNALYFKNITLLILNEKEAAQIANLENSKKAGRSIQEQLKCNVLITQGPEGMILFKENKIKHFPAEAKEVFDVAGAGDTVVATFSLSLASGTNFEEAAIIANHAAGIAVGKIGTATVSPEELIDGLKNNYG